MTIRIGQLVGAEMLANGREWTKAQAVASLRAELRAAERQGWAFTASMLRRDIRDLLAGEG